MSAEVIGQREYDGWLGFKRRYIYPFRWFYQSHIQGLRFRFRCIRIFASAVWHWDSCDYAPTLKLMEIAFKEISRLHSENGHLVSSDKTAKQTLIVSELCRRLHDDDYHDLAKGAIGTSRKFARWGHIDYLGRQDSEYLGRMFKFVRHWWN
jgi:hypothetical protein